MANMKNEVKRVPLTFQLDFDLKKRFSDVSRRIGENPSSTLRRLVNDFLKEHGQGKLF